MSESALKKCKMVCKDFSNVVLSGRDLESLKFSEEFDVIICDFVMAHMENPKLVVENFFKALKRGALF